MVYSARKRVEEDKKRRKKKQGERSLPYNHPHRVLKLYYDYPLDIWSNKNPDDRTSSTSKESSSMFGIPAQQEDMIFGYRTNMISLMYLVFGTTQTDLLSHL